MKRVLIFAAKAGGGHVSNARAIKNQIEARILGSEVVIADHWEILGLAYNTWLYNFCLRHNLIRFYEGFLRPLLLVVKYISLPDLWLPHILARYFRKLPHKPDIIISNSPILNGTIAKAMELAWPDHMPPFYIVFPDWADYRSPNLKFTFDPSCFSSAEKIQNVRFQCCTNAHVKSVLDTGFSWDNIVMAEGLVLDEAFYRYRLSSEKNRKTLKAEAGFDPDRPLAIVSFGGYGSSVMLELLRKRNKAQLKTQMIFLCGRNKDLAKALRRECRDDDGLKVLEYTDKVAQYMAFCDLFIGKPGPNSVSEALTMGLIPLILNVGAVLEQEQATVDYVLQNKLGKFFNNVEALLEHLVSVSTSGKTTANLGIQALSENSGLEVASRTILELCKARLDGTAQTIPNLA